MSASHNAHDGKTKKTQPDICTQASSSIPISLPPPPIPFKHRSVTALTLNPSSDHHFAHARKSTSTQRNPNSFYFFKHHTDHPDYTHEIEAAVCGFYHFIAPYHTPSARAVYDKDYKYIGIASKSLLRFKSLLEDPLQESDLSFDILSSLSMSQLEALDQRARMEKMNLDEKPDRQIIHEYAIPRMESTGKSIQMIPVTAKDLRNYRIAKGLAIGLTCSYIFAENNCNTGNLSKDGQRINFSESPCPVTIFFKKSSAIELTLRDPMERFGITVRDISHFPYLQDAVPFYWPTKPVKFVPDALVSATHSFSTITANEYQPHENRLFQSLSTHPVFIHHKFATLLKFILTTSEHYKNICFLHIRHDALFQDQSVIDMLSSYMEERIMMFKETLLTMSHFKYWLSVYGDSVLENMLADFAARNKKMTLKLTEKPFYQSQILDLDNITRNYAALCKRAGIEKDEVKTQSTLKLHI